MLVSLSCWSWWWNMYFAIYQYSDIFLLGFIRDVYLQNKDAYIWVHLSKKENDVLPYSLINEKRVEKRKKKREREEREKRWYTNKEQRNQKDQFGHQTLKAVQNNAACVHGGEIIFQADLFLSSKMISLDSTRCQFPLVIHSFVDLYDSLNKIFKRKKLQIQDLFNMGNMIHVDFRAATILQ